jgi:hypothetical protein
LNDLVMNTPDLFKRNHAGTCIQHTHKSNRVWSHTFLLHLSKEFQCLLPLPASHMSEYHDILSDHTSGWRLVEHCPSILNAPTFCIHINCAIPHKDVWLQTQFVPSQFLYFNGYGLSISSDGAWNNQWNKFQLPNLSIQLAWKKDV